jgi:signal transduction histidine kinase
VRAGASAGSGPFRASTNDRWLNLAAFATWLAVAVPTISDIATGELAATPALGWGAMFLAFGAALVDCLRGAPIARGRRLALMGVQAAAGLGMMHVGVNGTAGALLVVVAAQAAIALPGRGAWLWAAMQTLGIAMVVGHYEEWSDTVALTGAYAGFQGFAIAAISLASRERTARERLARANEELTATRSLLAEHSRAAERLRIARDVHDTLGHHLTALSLQLDVASRLATGPAEGHIREAHAITRLLLADVRDVVSQMRESGRVDLAQALKAMTTARGAMTIHLDLPESLPVEEADRAQAVVRCVQEIITNAARHSSAANLWIRIAPHPRGIEVHARDDGRGAAVVTWGHGLVGMRERFAALSGSIEVTTAAGGGFEVRGFMPGPGAAA